MKLWVWIILRVSCPRCTDSGHIMCTNQDVNGSKFLRRFKQNSVFKRALEENCFACVVFMKQQGFFYVIWYLFPKFHTNMRIRIFEIRKLWQGLDTGVQELSHSRLEVASGISVRKGICETMLIHSFCDEYVLCRSSTKISKQFPQDVKTCEKGEGNYYNPLRCHVRVTSAHIFSGNCFLLLRSFENLQIKQRILIVWDVAVDAKLRSYRFIRSTVRRWGHLHGRLTNTAFSFLDSVLPTIVFAFGMS